MSTESGYYHGAAVAIQRPGSYAVAVPIIRNRFYAGLSCGSAADGLELAIAAVSGHGPRMRVNVAAWEHLPLADELAGRVRAAIAQASASWRGARTVSIADAQAELSAFLAQAAAGWISKNRLSPLEGVAVAAPLAQLCLPGSGDDIARPGAAIEIFQKAIFACRIGVPVIADLAASAMAHGRSPLHAYCLPQWLMFRDARLSRVALNLGGMASLTFLAADSHPADVTAFDAAPCGIVLDGLTRQEAGIPFDRDGMLASGGRACPPLLHELLATPPLGFRAGKRRDGEEGCLIDTSLGPPATLPPDAWGDIQTQRLVLMARKHGCIRKQDIMATATEAVAISIAAAIEALTERPHEVILSGGGAMNIHLAGRVRSMLSPSSTVSIEKFGLPSPRSARAVFLAAAAALRIEAMSGTHRWPVDVIIPGQ